jgi:nitroreductase
MNPKLNLIFARRSVRQYAEREIPEDALHDLLEAAMAAPSACAKDPWHFVVVRRREALQALAAGLPNGRMLASAGAGVVVCGRLAEAHGGLESYMLQDCSAAIENLLLAAAALGLGACWLGVHPRAERMEHVARALGLPGDATPVGVVSLGWPLDRPAARTRFHAAKVHREGW